MIFLQQAVQRIKNLYLFNATQQHVRNVNILLQCEECGLWRLLFSKKKLIPQAVTQLQNLLEDISYSCGATFEDITMPEGLESVCVKRHNCYDPIEKLYYSCGFEPICIYCAASDGLEFNSGNASDYYPQCDNCSLKPRIMKANSVKRQN
jgi:hypothetical protein